MFQGRRTAPDRKGVAERRTDRKGRLTGRVVALEHVPVGVGGEPDAGDGHNLPLSKCIGLVEADRRGPDAGAAVATTRPPAMSTTATNRDTTPCCRCLRRKPKETHHSQLVMRHGFSSVLAPCEPRRDKVPHQS